MSDDQPPPQGIMYGEKHLANMSHKLSKLKPVEPGDLCCNCGEDCDGEGFAIGDFHAHRVNGHPICARGRCYGAHLSEFAGRRDGCRCGANRRRKNSEGGVKA